jgi:hypothetical protein
MLGLTQNNLSLGQHESSRISSANGAECAICTTPRHCEFKFGDYLISTKLVVATSTRQSSVIDFVENLVKKDCFVASHDFVPACHLQRTFLIELASFFTRKTLLAMTKYCEFLLSQQCESKNFPWLYNIFEKILC